MLDTWARAVLEWFGASARGAVADTRKAPQRAGCLLISRFRDRGDGRFLVPAQRSNPSRPMIGSERGRCSWWAAGLPGSPAAVHGLDAYESSVGPRWVRRR